MNILKLELFNYLRFTVKSINYFCYEPETIIQIILGGNGSGKSSLLKELSPLPPDHNEFGAGGYKKLKISHNGSIYELLFEKGEKKHIYSFCKDGLELNPGHTVSIYRDLVRTEFNLTQDIHDLMTGAIRFSGMDIPSRRNWFTRLPSTDYSYAIRYYKKLAEALRDTTGAIKHISGKLLQEKEKNISDEEVASIKEDLLHLKEYLAFILESKKSVPYTVSEAEYVIDKANKNIVTTYTRMAELISSFNNDGNARSIEELSSQISELVSELNSVSVLQSHIYSEATKLESSIDELERNKVDSVDNLQKKMSERKQYISQILSTLNKNVVITNPIRELEILYATTPYLIETVSQLEPDPEKKHGREYLDRLNLKRSSLKNDLQNVETSLELLHSEKKRLDHIKEHGDINCPKCNFTFNNSFRIEEYQELLEKIQVNTDKASKINVDLTNVDESLEKIHHRFDLLRSFGDITRTNPGLDAFWTYLRSEVIFNKPSNIGRAIEEYCSDLKVMCEVNQLTEDEKTETSTLETLLSFKESSLSDLKKKYEEMSHSAYELQERKNAINAKLTSRKKALSIATEIHNLKLELENVCADRDDKINSLTEVIRNELRGKLVQAIQLEITARETRLTNITSHQRIISDLEDQITSLKNKKEVLQAAVTELSPSEGLIAKGITGFINHFISQMNSFISKIWSYPLELNPIVPDENLDLDYKFSLKVGDKLKSPDISRISKGQAEIIDLAFKLVASKYLGLSNFPLYLDELGSSFDKDHRHAIADMMHTLTTTSTFSQIFIISHYEEMYGSFKNTDVTVFHDPKFESMEGGLFNKVAKFG